jgi:hypothetical protein
MTENGVYPQEDDDEWTQYYAFIKSVQSGATAKKRRQPVKRKAKSKSYFYKSVTNSPQQLSSKESQKRRLLVRMTKKMMEYSRYLLRADNRLDPSRASRTLEWMIATLPRLKKRMRSLSQEEPSDKENF